jgi:cell pole-organizing protein PopZ
MVGEDGKVTELKRPAEAVPPPAMPAPAKPAEAEGLISAKAAAASASALANLAALSKPREVAEPPGGLGLGQGGITLEEMVRQELRGQLKTWLDANLTGIVERMVQKEIKRITSQSDPG